MFLIEIYVVSWLRFKASISPIDKQPFDCTTFVFEVLAVHGNELRLFGSRHSPYSNYQYRAPDIAPVGTIFNVFSNDAVLIKNHLPDDEQIRYL